MKVRGDTVNLDEVPWGPQYEHEVEMEFTPMDPRDHPEVRALNEGSWRFHNQGEGPYQGLLLVESLFTDTLG